MLHIKRLLILLFIGVISLTGCTKEDLSKCYDPCRLIVSVIVDSDDVQQQPVETAVLYIFDSDNGKYLGQQIVSSQELYSSQAIMLDYPKNNKITAVCWGNTNGNPFPVMTENSVISDLKSSLQMNNGYALSPQDLFHGMISINQKTDRDLNTRVLPIKRIVSSMVIRTKKLKEWVGTTSNDFHYVVRHTQSLFNYMGEIEGPLVSYRQQGVFDIVSNDFSTSVFNLIPTTSSNSIEVDIYHGNTLVYTLSKDENNQPIRAIRSKLLNILIDFGGTLNITVTITGWGDVDQSIII